MTDATTYPTRRVDWLELFFDLVFVVIIKRLTDELHGSPGLDDFAKVVGLFAVSWLAWLNVTTFVNLSGAQPSDRRVPVLISMSGVALIAISIPEATSSAAPLFAIGYSVARIAIWPLWMKVNRNSPFGWVRATIFGPGFAVLWLASILLPSDIRMWGWLLLVIGEVVFTASGFSSAGLTVAHLLERVGLFIMIVLGESVVELILAVHPDQSALAWAVSAGSFILICAIWWHYFQSGEPVSERMLEASSGVVLRDVIVVAHFFVVLGLIGIAAGLGSAIEHADDPHLYFGSVIALGGGIGLYHLANVIVAWRYGLGARDLAVLASIGVAVVAVFILGASWPAWVLVALLLVYMTIDAALAPWVIRHFRRTS